MKIIKFGCSEYRAFVLTDDGQIGMFAWDQAKLASHMQFFPLTGCTDVAGGLYQGCAIDGQGFAYTLSNKTLTATKAAADITGKPFDGNILIYAHFGDNFTIRKDGSVWTWGDNSFKLVPSAAAPAKLSYPSGLVFTKLAMGATILGLTDKGEVYEWSTGNPNPAKKSLPGSATDIFSSHNKFAGAVVAGDIYGWGDGMYLGTGSNIGRPTAMKAIWGFAGTITKVTANHNALHFLADDGDLYGLGDNAAGDVGNGEEKINKAETYPTPYVWDWKYAGGPMVTQPMHIAQGIKFKDIFTGSSFAFYHYAIDTKDNIYSWGRNKSMDLMNGRGANNEDAYPNWGDVLTPTLVTPLTTLNKGVTFVPYSLTAADQSITGDKGTLKATGVASTWYTIADWKWSQISGPSSATLSQGKDTSEVSGLVAGNYRFRVQMIDNNGATISREFAAVVAIPNQGPVANIAAVDPITLPTSSIVLDGSLSKDPDGSIAAYAWIQLSGPAPAELHDPTSAQCPINNLVAGEYVFQLVVTDDKGATATETVSVLVKARPVIVKEETRQTDSGLQVVATYSDGKTVTLN